MNEKLLTILLYLAGIPITYLLGKRCMIIHNIRTWKNIAPDRDPWTVKDRRYVIFISLASWVGFEVLIVAVFVDLIMRWSEKGEDKIAKW